MIVLWLWSSLTYQLWVFLNRYVVMSASAPFFRCCDNLQRENNKLHKVMPAFFGVWSSPLYRFLIDIFILTTSADGMLRNYKSILTTPIWEPVDVHHFFVHFYKVNNNIVNWWWCGNPAVNERDCCIDAKKLCHRISIFLSIYLI